MVNPPLAGLNSNYQFYLLAKTLVYSLDNGLCHIYKKRVDFKSATLDHIMPTSGIKDGYITTSEYWNLRIAHHYCNILRSSGKTPGQMRLPLPIFIPHGGSIYAMSRV